ncbi:hypothetical protein Sgri01_02870 [Streptomyces griseus]
MPPVPSVAPSSASMSQPRSVGNGDTASTPSATSCHSSSGEPTPPGRRHAMPTMAIGSSTAEARAAPGPPGALGCVRASGPPSSRVPMWAARRSGVGWSKTAVAGRRRPVAVLRRLRSSTAASESKPRARNGCPASTAAVESWPSTAPAWARTSSVRVCSRCSGVSPTRARARSLTAEAPRAAPAVVVRRRGRGAYVRRSGDRVSLRAASRRAARSSTSGMTAGCGVRRPASKRARPWAVVMGATPVLARRSTSPRSRWPVRPLACSQ